MIDKLSALTGMIKASVNSRSCKTVNQNWLDQFGTFNIPVALSEIIFCNNFPLHENGGKQENDKFCYETQNAFITLQARNQKFFRAGEVL